MSLEPTGVRDMLDGIAYLNALDACFKNGNISTDMGCSPTS